MPIQEINAKNKWVHIDAITEDVEAYLRDKYKFHPLDIEDVFSDRQRPKIDIYRQYIFFVAVFPHFDNDDQCRVRGREVDVFITRDALITVAKKPFPALSDIFQKVNSSPKLQRIWLEKGPSFLLYKILETLFRETGVAVDRIGRQLHEVEEDVYGNELKSVVRDLAGIRRSVLALRRMLDPQRFTINSLVNMRLDFIPEDMSHYFDNIHDYIEKMWVEIENCKDAVDGLHLTNESLLSQRTNQTIKVLTAISVGLMPLTLLSGIYGMNLVRLPYANEPIVVFGLFIILGLVIFGGVAWFYRKGRF
jgi:magnesium transporter